MPVDLSIIIVSWNVRELLVACLRSILEGSVAGVVVETIVVDNASEDSTVALIRKDFPWVRLLEPGENTGFARGNNIGVNAADGRYLLVLNPDTEIVADALPRLVTYLDGHPQVGVVGPQLLNPDSSIQSSRRRFPTFWTAVFESTWLEPIAPQRVLDQYFMRDTAPDETCEVDWVQGAAFAIRREVVEQVGAFDESFFMYSEELDWQKRIRQAGWRIVSYPAAKVVHHGGKSSDQIVAQRHIYFQTSKVHYFRKHHGPIVGGFVRAILLVNYLFQTALEAVKWGLGHKRELRKERVLAYWQVLRSGLRG